MDLKNKIREIEEEIDSLEEKELNWTNLERLSILYTVKHHMCKQMEMEEEDEEQEIGFRTNRRKDNFGGSESRNREIREITGEMNENELRELVNRHAQDLQERGNNGSYQRLYDRTRRYRRR